MKPENFRKQHEAVLESIATAEPPKSWDEKCGRIASEKDSRRCIELCDLFDSMTESEKARMAAIPAYQTDLRELADIRNKYNVSWNELAMLIRMTW